MKKSQESCIAENESLRSKYETAMNEKDADIASLQEVLGKIRQGATTTQLNKTNNNEDIFRLKPKLRKGSTTNINVNHLKCESRECTNTNVDLIKCNICLKWVCEECHNVAVNANAKQYTSFARNATKPLRVQIIKLNTNRNHQEDGGENCRIDSNIVGQSDLAA